jgi:hypothetical protein
MMVLNVGSPTSTIQLIIFFIPIDVIDRSDRLPGRAVPVGSGTRQQRWDLSGHSRWHGGADLVGCASQV